MQHVGDIEGSAVLELVRDRLTRYPGEYAWRRARVIAGDVETLDERRAYMNEKFDGELARGFCRNDPDKIPQARRCRLFLYEQVHADYYRSSADWCAFLAMDGADDWSSWARSLEDEGRHVLANAAVDAARWFDPSRSAGSILGARSPAVLELLEQCGPDGEWTPRWRAERDVLPVGGDDLRHWNAWGLKALRHALFSRELRNECHENVMTRGSSYEWLGGTGLAAIPALREALHDRHPYARAEAVRALGLLCDPVAIDALRAMARRDDNDSVRRHAECAAQRIVGYWTFYGEWRDVLGSPSRVEEVLRELASAGLGGFAVAILDAFGAETLGLAALRAELAPHSLEQRDRPVSSSDLWDASSSVAYRQAQDDEAALDSADLSTIPRLLESADVAHRIHALDVVGRYRLQQHQPGAAALVDAPGALGWTARRTLRRLGYGAWLPRERLHELR